MKQDLIQDPCVPPDPQDPTKYGPCPGNVHPTKTLWIYLEEYNGCKLEGTCSGNLVDGTFRTFEECAKCVQ